MSVNKVTLIGNLGKDPEIRNTQAGKKIATLSLATSESYTKKGTTERVTKTEWHRIVIFNEHLVGIAEKYLKKGSKAYIEGSLSTRKWTDNNSIERYTTEVVLSQYGGKIDLLDSRSVDTGDTKSGESGEGEAPPDHKSPPIDDDIPF
jgi:single-strand DNA-binding protein